MTGPHDLGHIVAGILCVLDWTNVGSILLAIVGAAKQLPSICIQYIARHMDNCKLCASVMQAPNKFKWNLFIIPYRINMKNSKI